MSIYIVVLHLKLWYNIRMKLKGKKLSKKAINKPVKVAKKAKKAPKGSIGAKTSKKAITKKVLLAGLM